MRKYLRHLTSAKLPYTRADKDLIESQVSVCVYMQDSLFTIFLSVVSAVFGFSAMFGNKDMQKFEMIGSIT